LHFLYGKENTVVKLHIPWSDQHTYTHIPLVFVFIHEYWLLYVGSANIHDLNMVL